LGICSDFNCRSLWDEVLFVLGQGEQNLDLSSGVERDDAECVSQDRLVAGQHNDVLWQAAYKFVKVFASFCEHFCVVPGTCSIHFLCLHSNSLNSWHSSTGCTCWREIAANRRLAHGAWSPG